ncbi:uncharacterized protein [Physcomitrium patens]|uniref:uncharacterized protein n=1 Tax=Physcomitrium patens TaxID=3218 RepID=UPI003CCCB00B
MRSGGFANWHPTQNPSGCPSGFFFFFFPICGVLVVALASACTGVALRLAGQAFLGGPGSSSIERGSRKACLLAKSMPALCCYHYLLLHPQAHPFTFNPPLCCFRDCNPFSVISLLNWRFGTPLCFFHQVARVLCWPWVCSDTRRKSVPPGLYSCVCGGHKQYPTLHFVKNFLLKDVVKQKGLVTMSDSPAVPKLKHGKVRNLLPPEESEMKPDNEPEVEGIKKSTDIATSEPTDIETKWVHNDTHDG